MRKQIKNWIRSLIVLGSLTSILLIFTSCESHQSIVSNIDEKEANVILVLLESKNIPAQKVRAVTSQIGGESTPKYSIMVPEKESINAIAYLNQNGFPRQQGTNLLDLFAKQGLMTSDREETIRYHAGLSQQLTNTILMIDGVIDASVQLSFPPQETLLSTVEEKEKPRITAAVYVKHQGVVDDPNFHLENKIKRLISGSVTGLDINDVTVVSDRSRFTDITLGMLPESLSGKPGEYISIWNIVMSKESAARFRFLFFFITIVAVILAIAFGWLVWKFYPTLKKKGTLKALFTSSIPWLGKNNSSTKPPENS